MFKGKSSIIEGKRVRMRPIEKKDLEKTLKWANDPEIAYYTGYIFPVSMEMEVKWYERILAEESRKTFIIENKESVVIGLTAILNIDWKNRKAELSMLIGEKEYWGKGVSVCSTCDAPFFKDKEVIVVGGGSHLGLRGLPPG